MSKLRIRSRDGMERVPFESWMTVADLKRAIFEYIQIPICDQTLSSNAKLLLANSDRLHFSDMSDPNSLLTDLNIQPGSIIYLAYEGERVIPGPKHHPAGSFGQKMTMDDLIAKQMRIVRQETPHCDSASFDRDCANVFQHYVNDQLSFAVKRGGFMYGTVSEEGKVGVDFIYEPPQHGEVEGLLFMRDQVEEELVDTIAKGLGMRRVGFIFTQTVTQDKMGYTMSSREVLQAVEFHAESGLKEWVTAIVKLEMNEQGSTDVHFETFQMSDTCLRLFNEGWFERGIGDDTDPKVSKMTRDVVLGVKDVREVDNDFFLVVVKIQDHQGPLSTTFPVENRCTPATKKDLKALLDRKKDLPFVKQISDFHLLLFLTSMLSSDIFAVAECVRLQTPVPEGYELLIKSMANS